MPINFTDKETDSEMACRNLELHPSDVELIIIVEQVYILVKVLILLSDKSKKEHHSLLKELLFFIKPKIGLCKRNPSTHQWIDYLH